MTELTRAHLVAIRASLRASLTQVDALLIGLAVPAPVDLPVTSAECLHERRLDVSGMGGGPRKWFCPDCEAEWAEERN